MLVFLSFTKEIEADEKTYKKNKNEKQAINIGKSMKDTEKITTDNKRNTTNQEEKLFKNSIIIVIQSKNLPKLLPEPFSSIRVESLSRRILTNSLLLSPPSLSLAIRNSCKTL